MAIDVAGGPDMRYYVHASTEAGKAQMEYLRNSTTARTDAARERIRAGHRLWWTAVAVLAGLAAVGAWLLWR